HQRQRSPTRTRGPGSDADVEGASGGSTFERASATGLGQTTDHVVSTLNRKRRGDGETGRRGDGVTGGPGGGEAGLSPAHRGTPSPRHPVTPSPRLPVSPCLRLNVIENTQRTAGKDLLFLLTGDIQIFDG